MIIGLLSRESLGSHYVVMELGAAWGLDKITCPLLVLWGARGKIGQWYDPMKIWRQYCTGDVTAGALETGHYLAEEDPQGVIDRFIAFFL